MRIAVAQLNPTIGSLQANVAALLDAVARARSGGATCVVAPELAITGYPPRDLLERADFVRDAIAALDHIRRQVQEPTVVLGAIVGNGADPLEPHNTLSNAAVVLHQGAIIACHRKMLLPTYDVFDEARYFTPGTSATIATLGGVRTALTVCEDIWNDKRSPAHPTYTRDPVAEAVQGGAQLILNISASPFDRTKPQLRAQMLRRRAREHHCPVLYVNQVGGNDSLIFDGRSQAFDADGRLAMRATAYAEALTWLTLEEGGKWRATVAEQPESGAADLTAALCLGLQDYVRKCGFSRVVLGLSGGIDSAVTAALAVRALGAERVMGVAMPSRYSSAGSLEDAAALAHELGIRCDTVPIEPMFASFLSSLAAPFAGLAPDVTEENLQARIRGALLMAYSNKLGALLLTTGNKSELAVGYSTLYGDMCGGLAVISDLYKTEVYAVARYLNAEWRSRTGRACIPETSLTKPPSAELKPNQTDQDTLPAYDLLDAVLRLYVDEARSIEAVVAAGYPPDQVQRIMTMVDRAEYKRRQMAPGLRVSAKAFGEGRRLPIAARYTPHPAA